MKILFGLKSEFEMEIIVLLEFDIVIVDQDLGVRYRNSVLQAGTQRSYPEGILGLPDDGYVPPDFWRSGKKTEKNGPLEGLKWRKIRIFVNFMTLIGTFLLEI